MVAKAWPSPVETFLPNCMITNASGVTIPAFSICKVSVADSVNTSDPAPLNESVTISVVQCDDSSSKPLVSSGAFAIPAGGTGPGYIGALLPIALAGTGGARYSPKPATWTIEANANGPLMLVDPGKGGVALYLYDHTGGDSTPRIQFRVKTKMVDRQATVYVTKIEGNAVDPADDSLLAVDDEVVVNDPQNLWSSVEPDCFGWANYRVLSDGARWEIEECSLPASEIRGYLTDCMLKCDASASVIILDPEDASTSARPAEVNTNCTSTNGPQNQVIRSGYPEAMLPPDFDFAGGASITITAYNRLKLDGMKGSSVVLKRCTNRIFPEPTNTESPKARSTTAEEWRIVHVERRKARWIWGLWGGESSPTITGFCDGDDPRSCTEGTVSINALADVPCDISGKHFIAFYNPESDQYHLVSTQSAWMGPPDTLNHLGKVSTAPDDILAFDGCVLNANMQPHKGWPCALDSSTESASPVLTTVPVMQNVSETTDTEGNPCLSFSRVTVDVCIASVGTPVELCGDPCDAPNCDPYS